MIDFFRVSRRFPTGQIGLSDVSCSIARGEFVFLAGASGAGKSTWLKMIFRGDVPSEGHVVVAGRNLSTLPRAKIPYLRRSIGVVFQDFRLIERKTVFENVSFLPRILGFDQARQKRAAFEALRRVGLAHRMSALPRELSGGEQQRVAIARALINDPEILLADEPTGNLDSNLAREIARLFVAANLRGTTVVVASHDRDLVERIGGRVLTLAHGRLVEDVQVPRGEVYTLAAGSLATPASAASAAP